MTMHSMEFRHDIDTRIKFVFSFAVSFILTNCFIGFIEITQSENQRPVARIKLVSLWDLIGFRSIAMTMKRIICQHETCLA